jgi:molybdate transport system substrate-binding protein
MEWWEMTPWKSALACLIGCAIAATGRAEETAITVAAADSTCAAVREVGKLFLERHRVRVDPVCKSSGRLAKGIAGGAISTDFFISANQEWMDELVATGHVSLAAVRSLWSNVLAVAAPRGGSLRIESLDDLAQPTVRRILIGDPGTAPFGRYTKQSLEQAGIWEKVLPRVTSRKNISLLVDSLAGADDGTVGILFASHLDDRIRVLATIPAPLHDPIRYFSAPLKAAEGKAPVAAFAAFVESAEAKEIFRKFGFGIVE